MNKPTYEEKIQALKESIKHWEENAENPENASISSGACACCRLVGYEDDGVTVRCDQGCPIYEKTGEPGCDGTPYVNIRGTGQWARTKEMMLAEVIFLKDLYIEMLEKRKEMEAIEGIGKILEASRKEEKKKEYRDITDEIYFKFGWEGHLEIRYQNDLLLITDKHVGRPHYLTLNFWGWDWNREQGYKIQKEKNGSFRILKRQ